MTVIAVIDIDTTIANNDHRAALLEKTCKECSAVCSYTHRSICSWCGAHGVSITQESWDAFLRPDLMALDTPVDHCRDVIDSMRKHRYRIVFLTGRNEGLREVTSQWLRTHMDWDSSTEPLIMRPQSMTSVPASQYKEQELLTLIRLMPPSLGKITFLFFEDDKYVLNVWRKYGLVFKCPEAWASMHVEAVGGEEPGWKR